jgi:hypothetical protein
MPPRHGGRYRSWKSVPSEGINMRVLVRLGLVIVCVAASSSAAFAQATIAGVVRDASGAVLPGVTV